MGVDHPKTMHTKTQSTNTVQSQRQKIRGGVAQRFHYYSQMEATREAQLLKENGPEWLAVSPDGLMPERERSPDGAGRIFLCNLTYRILLVNLISIEMHQGSSSWRSRELQLKFYIWGVCQKYQKGFKASD